jgi:hypothetical protein
MIDVPQVVQQGLDRAASLQDLAGPPRAELARHWCSLLLLLLAAGCSYPSAPRTGVPATGTLALRVVTNVEFDPNGYSLRVDRAAPKFVPTVFPGYEREVIVSELSAGVHRLSVSGVAAHCAASPPSSVAFTVSAGATAQVKIAIVCATAERPKAMPTAR